MANEPELVEPIKEYLGVSCSACGGEVPIVGPLDPVAMPPDQPMQIGARGPLHATCPHCRHSDDYPIDQIRRVRMP